VDMSPEPSQQRERKSPQHGKSRLIMSKVQWGESPAQIDHEDSNGEAGGDGTTDPLIRGLVERLPKPDCTWSLADRAKWLRTAASIFGLVYKASDSDGQEIRVVFSKDEPERLRRPFLEPGPPPPDPSTL
jgi:hypothetical protein